MLPTLQQDVWKPATETDMLAALASLAVLPARNTANSELDRDLYFVALENTTRYGLGQAVKAILRGALGHEFFPSPVALRLQCDKAMEHHQRMRERIAHQERMERDRIPEVAPKTEAQKARVAALMRDFHASIDNGREAEAAALIERERAEVRARYGMTDETLASLPAAGSDKSWRRPTPKFA